MSNPGNAQGQQAPGQRQFPGFLRPDDIKKLSFLDDANKAKYSQAFQSLWNVLESKPAEAPEYKQAYARLAEWSGKIRQQHQQLAARRAQQQGAQQRPPNAQAPEQASQEQAQQARQGPAQPQQQPQAPQQPQQQGQRPPNAPGQSQIPPNILAHIQKFQFVLPPNIAAGTVEGDKRLKELKNSYALALTRQEQSAQNIKRCNLIIEQRKSQGQEVPAEVMNQKGKAENQYDISKRFVDDFRSKQLAWGQQSNQQQAQGAGAQVKVEAGATAPNAALSQPAPTQAASQPSQQAQASQATQQAQQNQQAQQQNAQQSNLSNAATAGPGQNQANAAAIKSPVSATQPGQMQSQMATSMASQPANQQQAHPMNQARPQFQQPAAQAGQIHQGSPHTQVNNPSGPPRPLTHQDAVTAAAKSYSDRQVPQQASAAAQGQTPVGSREQMNTTNQKWPLTKSPIPPPQPVSMGPSRPTLGGPSTGAPGMMGQPVLPKVNSYVLEGDNDRVLSKKKLDELVRQVTGGGEGTTGEVITSEVEEAMLQLADDFVDEVISDACKLSKLRESPQLDIRDIQLVLERKYNIRIPGYASDEIRTVRKVQPAPGWTQKMNAVQAAKVMGGKADI